MLATLDFSPAKDANGNNIVFEPTFTNGITEYVWILLVLLSWSSPFSGTQNALSVTPIHSHVDLRLGPTSAKPCLTVFLPNDAGRLFYFYSHDCFIDDHTTASGV